MIARSPYLARESEEGPQAGLKVQRKLYIPFSSYKYFSRRTHETQGTITDLGECQNTVLKGESRMKRGLSMLAHHKMLKES